MLQAHNTSLAGPPNSVHLTLVLHDGAGQPAGGLQARIAHRWLFVESLFVPEPLRHQGQGRALVLQAEQFARDHACIGLWLDTFTARPFYEKLGYTIFGQLQDHPLGHTQFWLQKRF